MSGLLKHLVIYSKVWACVWTRNQTINNTVLEIFSSPTGWGVSELSKYSIVSITKRNLYYRTRCFCWKDYGGRRSLGEVQSRNAVQLVKQEAPRGSVHGPPSVGADGEALMVSRGSLALPAGLGLDFGSLSLLHKCLKALFAPLTPK